MDLSPGGEEEVGNDSFIVSEDCQESHKEIKVTLSQEGSDASYIKQYYIKDRTKTKEHPYISEIEVSSGISDIHILWLIFNYILGDMCL